MKTKKSYLIWVGHEHYNTIDSYTDEAGALGVSKRLPDVKVAQAVAEVGTVVFVAHDEGKYKECPSCAAMVECPECRKAEKRLSKMIDEWDQRRELLGKAVGEKERGKKQRSLQRIEKRMATLNSKIEDCLLCNGDGEYFGGTGGKVIFGDGDSWDYRTYTYWLHQPAVWKPEDKGGVKTDMCKECGGKGKMPVGFVFGFFIPSGIEYIARENDTDELKEAMKKHKAKIIEPAMVRMESKRGCGIRKPGGVYVVADTKSDGEHAKKVLETMIKNGTIKPESAEINGDFVKFLEPIPIKEKRFRGIKRWEIVEEVAEELKMALDAME